MKYVAVLLVAVCLFGCVYTEEKINDESDAQGRLILSRSTFTSVSLSSTTITVPFSCNRATGVTTACAGRRKRRSAVKASTAPLASPEDVVPELTASQDFQKDAATSGTNERLFFTVMTTSFTTLTLTSSITDFQTTVSYSLACTVAGMSLLPEC